MPRIAFTSNLERHLACPTGTVRGNTVGAALRDVFRSNPRLESYILDDQGRTRRHVVIYVNGARISDPVGLGDPIDDDDEIFVFQALSGG